MVRKAVLAAVAASPFVIAQDVTASATRCTTRFGFYPLPTGTLGTAAVPTWYRFTTTTNILQVTSISRDTVTVTPTATTLTDVVVTTEVTTTTSTSTPVPTTIPTPAGFLPLLVAQLAGPTGSVGRFKRAELEYRGIDAGLPLLKRQTAANNVGGFSVSRDGNSTNMYRTFPLRVDCRVTFTVNTTQTTVVSGTPDTVLLPGATSLAVSTSTVSVVTTVTEVLPRETIYAACQNNNVVNHITGFTGNELVFDRVIYRPAEGFPIANEIVVNTTSATNCCIACQNTPFCAGSFYVPKPKECHLRLTQAAPVPAGPAVPALAARALLPSGAPYAFPNGSDSEIYYALNSASSFVPVALATGVPDQPVGTGSPVFSNSEADRLGSFRRPNATGFVGTGFVNVSYALPTGTAYSAYPSGVMPPLSTGTAAPVPNTCPSGSLSLYLGTIQGQEDFPEEYALSFSNGPCGRLSVWPIPIREGLDTSLEDRK